MVLAIPPASPRFSGFQIEYKGSPKAPEKAIFTKAAFNNKQPDGLIEIRQTHRLPIQIGSNPEIARLSRLFRESAGAIPTNFSERFIRGLQQVVVSVSKPVHDKPLKWAVSQYTALYNTLAQQLTALIKSGDVKPRNVSRLSGQKPTGQTIRLQKDPQLDPTVFARLNTLVAVIQKEFPKSKYPQAQWFNVKSETGKLLMRIYSGPGYPEKDTGVILPLGRHPHTHYDEAKFYHIDKKGKILAATHWMLLTPLEKYWEHGHIQKDSEYAFVNTQLRKILNRQKGATIIGNSAHDREYDHAIDFKSLKTLTLKK